MSNNMDILVILTPGFPASEEDTTCLPMQQEFVRVLKKEYPQVRIRVLAFQYPYDTRKYTWEGIEVLPFNGQNKGGVKRLWLRRKIKAELERTRLSGRIIGLISFWYGECAVSGHQFGKRHGIPHRCWLLGQDAKKENRYPSKFSLPGNELVALSDFLKDEFEKNHGVRPFTVIPPVVPLPGQMDRARDIDIVGAGSLIPLKQFDQFLDVVSAVQKELPTLKAVLIGDGPLKEFLQARANELGLNKSLVFTGELAHPHVLDFMARSKLLVHPSSYEGFSGVCLEALSRGCRVLSFCQPMEKEIENWKVAGSIEEMKNETLKILTEFDSNHHPVIPFQPQQTVRNFIEIFGMKERI